MEFLAKGVCLYSIGCLKPMIFAGEVTNELVTSVLVLPLAVGLVDGDDFGEPISIEELRDLLALTVLLPEKALSSDLLNEQLTLLDDP